jgi:hypothetical protein
MENSAQDAAGYAAVNFEPALLSAALIHAQRTRTCLTLF